MPIFTAEERLGQTIAGKYRLERILGEGGMGVVFDARHETLGRPVAVKFLHVALAREDAVVRRFLNEARAASSLAHPNVVDVLDVGTTDDNVPYIVMERLDGESLASRIAREAPLALDTTWALLRPAMEAIAFAHARSVVHRDLKPDNVFLHRNAKGEAITKVLDFGIAKLGSDASAGATATGALLGTAFYMAPEQSRGRGVGAWSDVWAMGVVWFEALTGRFPFDVDRSSPTTEVLVRLSVDAPAPIASLVPAIPPAVAKVIDRALSKDVKTRYADMSEMLREMDAAVGSAGDTPTRATSPANGRAVRLGMGLAAVLALAAIGIGIASSSSTSQGATPALPPSPAPVIAAPPPGIEAAPPELAPSPAPLAQGVDPPAIEIVPPPSIASTSSSARRAAGATTTTAAPPASAPATSAPPSRAQPTREEVLAAMNRVAPALHACGEYGHGIARLHVFVEGSTGRVTRAQLTGALSNTVAGGCVVRALRGVSFPAFHDQEFVFTYPVEI